MRVSSCEMHQNRVGKRQEGCNGESWVSRPDPPGARQRNQREEKLTMEKMTSII